MRNSTPRLERRHFEFIASVLKEMNRDATSAEDQAHARRVTKLFTDACRRTNSGFKPLTFAVACGLDEEV
jgi:hypothetical protein